MLKEMTATQYIAWTEYDSLHPIGDLRAEAEGARLRAYLGSLVQGKRRPISDFMWSFIPEKKLEPKTVPQRILSALGLRKPDGD